MPGLGSPAVALGIVTATTGPAIASLTGDYFPAADRGRMYGLILGGDLLGSGFGYLVSGDLSTLAGWRVSFWWLAAPSLALAWVVWRLPEPARGGQSRIAVGDGRIRDEREFGPGEDGFPAGHGDGATAAGEQDPLAVRAIRKADVQPRPGTRAADRPHQPSVVVGGAIRATGADKRGPHRGLRAWVLLLRRPASFAVTAAAGAGLPVLAAVSTGIYLVVALAFPLLTRRLPRSATAISLVQVRYPDGQGMLREVLKFVTAQGFAVDELSTAAAGDERRHADGARDTATGRPMVKVTLQVHGRGLVNELAAGLSEIPGVLAVIADDAHTEGE